MERAPAPLPLMLSPIPLEELRAAWREDMAEIADTSRRPADDGPLDRTGAAQWLKISLAKLDQLCRRETDPLPYFLCGDSRRFFRGDLGDWVRRQRAGAAK